MSEGGAVDSGTGTGERPRPGKPEVLVAPPDVLERGLCAAVASAKASDRLALVVVLTPGAVTSDAVARILADGLGTVANVEIFTYAGFVEMLSAARHGNRPAEDLGPAQARVLARSVTAHAKGWFEPLAGMPGFGDAFHRFLAELRGARVSPEALTRAGLPIEIRRKLSSLATSAREFEERRARRRTHEDRVEDATVVVERTMGGVAVMLYGVTADTDADAKLLERICHATAVTAFVPLLRPPAGTAVTRVLDVLRRSGAKAVTAPPEPEAAGNPTALAHLQRHLFRVPDQPAPDDSSVRLVSAHGPAAEARAAARACAAWASSGVAYGEMAVAVPAGSQAYADLVAAALVEVGVPFHDIVPRALAGTPAGRAALSAAATRDAGTGAALDAGGSWADRVDAVVRRIGAHLDGADAVVDALDGLRLDGMCDVPGDTEFRDACRVALAYPGGNHGNGGRAEPGVVIVAADRVGLARFSAVALVGLAEGFLPRSLAPATLLSDAEKIRLNEALAAELPLAGSALERDPADFAGVVLAARRSLLLAAPRAGLDGVAVSASPYFRAACIALEGEPVPATGVVSSPRVAREPPVDAGAGTDAGPGATAWNARRQGRVFTGYEGIVEPAALELLEHPLPAQGLSPTRLETYAGCPFRFLVENVYGARRHADGGARFGLDARDRGSLVHQVLERFLREVDDDPPAEGRREMQVALLDAAAAYVFEEYEERGTTGLPAVWEQTRAAILADLHRWWEIEAGIGLAPGPDHEQGWRPRMLEVAFGRHGQGDEDDHPGLVFETAVGPVEIAGRIDRIDVSADGTRFRVLDYKTGGAPSGASPGPPGLQLPIYSRAAAALTGLPLDTGSAQYFHVTRKAGFARLQPEVTAGADLDAIVDALCGGIAAGDFHPDPSTCRRTGSCEYPEICTRQVDALTRGRAVPNTRGAAEEVDP